MNMDRSKAICGLINTARRRKLRPKLAAAQDNKCYYCGTLTTLEQRKINSATIEHLIPRSLGGTNRIENLVMCCASCNSLRGNLPIEDFIYPPDRSTKKGRRQFQQRKLVNNYKTSHSRRLLDEMLKCCPCMPEKPIKRS